MYNRSYRFTAWRKIPRFGGDRLHYSHGQIIIVLNWDNRGNSPD